MDSQLKTLKVALGLVNKFAFVYLFSLVLVWFEVVGRMVPGWWGVNVGLLIIYCGWWGTRLLLLQDAYLNKSLKKSKVWTYMKFYWMRVLPVVAVAFVVLLGLLTVTAAVKIGYWRQLVSGRAMFGGERLMYQLTDTIEVLATGANFDRSETGWAVVSEVYYLLVIVGLLAMKLALLMMAERKTSLLTALRRECDYMIHHGRLLANFLILRVSGNMIVLAVGLFFYYLSETTFVVNLSLLWEFILAALVAYISLVVDAFVVVSYMPERHKRRDVLQALELRGRVRI